MSELRDEYRRMDGRTKVRAKSDWSPREYVTLKGCRTLWCSPQRAPLQGGVAHGRPDRFGGRDPVIQADQSQPDIRRLPRCLQTPDISLVQLIRAV